MRLVIVAVMLAVMYFGVLRLITGEWIPFSDLLEELRKK